MLKLICFRMPLIDTFVEASERLESLLPDAAILPRIMCARQVGYRRLNGCQQMK